MKTLILFAAFLAAAPDWVQSMLFLEGATLEEEVDQNIYEQYSDLAGRPLEINGSGLGALTGSGLFSQYQASCILEYIEKSGPIVSFVELGAIDGIGQRRAEALRPFITLGAYVPLKKGSSRRFSSDAVAKTGMRNSVMLASKAKGHFSYGQLVQANLAFSKGSPPTSFSLEYSPRKVPVSFIIGDFNARFGQGLSLWSGSSFSGLRAASAFLRNASGLTPSGSFSSEGRLRGAAAVYSPGRFSFSAFASLRDVFGGNVRYFSHRGTYGITAFHSPVNRASLVAADATLTFASHLTAFFEGAYSWGPALQAGLVWSAAYKTAFALSLRNYSPFFSSFYTGTRIRDEKGISLSASWRFLDFSSDALSHPLKGTLKHKARLSLKPSFSIGPYECTLYACWCETYTDFLRDELRAEALVQRGILSFKFRSDLVRAGGGVPDWQWYLESGAKGEKAFVWLRAGIFKVESWDSRIYVYERDIPTNFNVWAYYGKGWQTSLYAGWRRFYLRAWTIRYPWMVGKEPRTEIKIGCKLKI